MKLYGEDVVFPDGGAVFDSVIRCTGDNCVVLRRNVKGVDKVKIRFVGNAGERRRRSFLLNRVPADLRDFQPAAGGKPLYCSAENAEPFLSHGNQYGEGWFLAGEMVELIHTGAPNIVCIQPFACLPNHVVGKGVIKALREKFPVSNVVAIDYDPGASEVNQLNRIKLMLSNAARNQRDAANAETAGPAVGVREIVCR